MGLPGVRRRRRFTGKKAKEQEEKDRKRVKEKERIFEQTERQDMGEVKIYY